MECRCVVTTDHWKGYNDPDGETEVVRFKDQGLIHQMPASVDYGNGIPRAASYIAASLCHSRDWPDFLDNTRLPSSLETVATSQGVSQGIHISTGDSSQ